jgi:hypothetical protein
MSKHMTNEPIPNETGLITVPGTDVTGTCVGLVAPGWFGLALAA